MENGEVQRVVSLLWFDEPLGCTSLLFLGLVVSSGIALVDQKRKGL